MHRLFRPLPFPRLLVLLLTIGCCIAPVKAQTAGEVAATVRQLNQKLIEISRQAPVPTSASVAKELAQQRRDLLLQVLRSTPAEAKSLLLDASTTAALPATAQDLVERKVTTSGTVTAVVEDYADVYRVRYFLRRSDGDLEMYFVFAAPPNVSTGAQVQTVGYQIGTSLLVDRNELQVTSAAPQPNTFGAQSTLVLLVNFQDEMAQPYTTDQVQDVVFGATSNFMLENSQNQTWLTGDVFGWLTITLSSASCPYLLTLTSAVDQAAAAANINLANYNRHIFVLPHFACSWKGASTLGGSPSVVAINQALELDIVAHELGHSFGLWHSHSLVCPGTPVGTNCTVDEYGDRFDMMGGYTTSHFNAFQKERLGWLNYGSSLPITTATTSGTYTITPYESGQGSKAIKVLKDDGAPDGQRNYYYVEYRQPTGFDTVLTAYPASTTGVLIRSGNESDGNTSWLLNINPLDTSFADAALQLGQSFVDASSGVTIQILTADGTAATVKIGLIGGSGGCQHNPPQIAVTPQQSPAVSAGALVHYTLTITNADSIACAASSFLLATPVVPNGWTAAAATTYFSLAPGVSASTDLQVISPVTTAAGDYPVTLTILAWPNYSLRSSTTATYTVSGDPVPDFVFSVTPTMLTLSPGTSGILSVSSTSIGGFSSPISLSAAGLPANVTAQFTPAVIPAGSAGTSTLTVSAGSAAVPGNATVVITGSSTTLSHTIPVTMTITSAPAVLTSIAVTPTTPTLTAGSSLQFHATGTYSNGSSSDVTNQVAWASDSPAVATINSAGVAVGVSAGSCRISASLGGFRNSTTLTVTSPSPNNYTIFGNSNPGTQEMRYVQGAELGLKFISDVAGWIVAIRFYKSASAFGAHVGELWTINGQLLASAVFANETPFGWQQVTLPTPVSIQANTPYLASYHSDGPFSYTSLTSSIDSPPLHAPVSTLGGNGVYALGPVGTFPKLGSGNNYLVDVVFTTAASNSTLTSVAIAPANSSLPAGASQQFRATGTYSDGRTADISSQVAWLSGTTSVASINSSGLAIAISAGTTRISASLNGITTSTTLTVTGVPSTSYSLFGNASIYAQDTRFAQSAEVGLKFISDEPGSIIAIRFYKSSSAFGTHVGELWTINGQRLASAVFTNETYSGWQQVTLPAPVPIQANTPYVVSYHTDGPLSYIGFASSIDRPPLHAPVSSLGGNGVYSLGPIGTFPGLGGGTNYLVDVVFVH